MPLLPEGWTYFLFDAGYDVAVVHRDKLPSCVGGSQQTQQSSNTKGAWDFWCSGTRQGLPASHLRSCMRKVNFCVTSDAAVWGCLSLEIKPNLHSPVWRKAGHGTRYWLGPWSSFLAATSGDGRVSELEMRLRWLSRPAAETTKSHARAARGSSACFLSAAPKHHGRIHRPLAWEGPWRLSPPIPLFCW